MKKMRQKFHLFACGTYRRRQYVFVQILLTSMVHFKFDPAERIRMYTVALHDVNICVGPDLKLKYLSVQF